MINEIKRRISSRVLVLVTVVLCFFSIVGLAVFYWQKVYVVSNVGDENNIQATSQPKESWLPVKNYVKIVNNNLDDPESEIYLSLGNSIFRLKFDGSPIVEIFQAKASIEIDDLEMLAGMQRMGFRLRYWAEDLLVPDSHWQHIDLISKTQEFNLQTGTYSESGGEQGFYVDENYIIRSGQSAQSKKIGSAPHGIDYSLCGEDGGNPDSEPVCKKYFPPGRIVPSFDNSWFRPGEIRAGGRATEAIVFSASGRVFRLGNWWNAALWIGNNSLLVSDSDRDPSSLIYTFTDKDYSQRSLPWTWKYSYDERFLSPSHRYLWQDSYIMDLDTDKKISADEDFKPYVPGEEGFVGWNRKSNKVAYLFTKMVPYVMKSGLKTTRPLEQVLKIFDLETKRVYDVAIFQPHFDEITESDGEKLIILPSVAFR